MMSKELKEVGVASYMPATQGFTMACFKAEDVAEGCKLYIEDLAAANNAAEEGSWLEEAAKIDREKRAPGAPWNFKAAEEGELPALPSCFGTIEIYGDEDCAARVRSVDGFTADQMRGYAVDSITADRAAHPVANKAEVEPVAEWVNYEQGFQYLVKAPLPYGTKLYATPPATTGASTEDTEFLKFTLKRHMERVAELEAARIAYASEFPLKADGEPDVGNIHANIRALKAKVGASTVMTDERIEKVWDELPLTGAYTMAEARAKFARAIEREIKNG